MAYIFSGLIKTLENTLSQPLILWRLEKLTSAEKFIDIPTDRCTGTNLWTVECSRDSNWGLWHRGVDFLRLDTFVEHFGQNIFLVYRDPY